MRRGLIERRHRGSLFALFLRFNVRVASRGREPFVPSLFWELGSYSPKKKKGRRGKAGRGKEIARG